MRPAWIGLLLASACSPPTPTVTFEGVVMNADGLSYTARTTPGASLSCGPPYESGVVDATGTRTFHAALSDVLDSINCTADVSGTFGTSYGRSTLALPMSVDEAAMIRADGGAVLSVVPVSAAEMPEAGACDVSGFGGNAAPIGASGRCGFELRASEGASVTIDGAPVALDQRFEVDFTSELAALEASMFGFSGSVERTLTVVITSPNGSTERGSITVRHALLADALRSQVVIRSGRPFVDGASARPDVALLVGPESHTALLGRDAALPIEGRLSSASRIVVATHGATRDAPPCTGYTIEGGAGVGSLARVTTDVDLVVYDASTTTELGRVSVPGPGTGCPSVADSDMVVHDRPTDLAIAAAIWTVHGATPAR